MTVRTVRSADLPVLFEIYTAAFPFEYVPEKRFLRTFFLEPNFDPASVFVAEAAGDVQGFVIAPVQRVPLLAGFPVHTETGYVSALAVRPGASVPAVGGLLLDTAETYLRRKGVRRISTGYAPYYIHQGVETDRCPEYAELYRSRGYRGGESYAMRCDLSRYTPDPQTEAKRKALEADGFYIGPLQEKYLFSLLDPAAPFSSVGWSYEFSTRVRDCDFERIRICAKDGKVVACCVFGDSESDGERFGPFGTDPAVQGRGIGSVLLNDCLSEMKKRGLRSAWLQWGPTEGPAHHLYRKHGFVPEKHYVTFGKKTEEAP